MEIEQQVNGTPATLRVSETDISWTQDDPDSPHAGWTDVSVKNIITASLRNTGRHDEYNLLYAEENTSITDATKESPLVLEFLILSNYDASLFHRFHTSRESIWGVEEKRSENNILVDTHVVISTGAGTGLASSVWKLLIEPVLHYDGLRAGVHYKVHETTSDSSVTDLIRSTILPKANKGVEQSILLLSGDGGIVDIVNTLLAAEHTAEYKKPVVTLLPLGTGNALANSAVVKDDSTMGLRTMLNGQPKELPIFRATFSPGARLVVNGGKDEQVLESSHEGNPVAHGAVVLSWGLHATLVADSDTAEYRKHGAERFKMAANEALFPSDGSAPHPYKGKVSVLRPGKDDWEAIPRDEHGYILATLVSQLEAGFTISPASRPLDGKLKLVHFGALSGQDAMEIMTKAYQGGRHVHDERVGYEEILGLRIEFDEEDGRWWRVCLDGKIVRVEKGGWVEVRSGVKGVVDLISRED